MASSNRLSTFERKNLFFLQSKKRNRRKKIRSRIDLRWRKAWDRIGLNRGWFLRPEPWSCFRDHALDVEAEAEESSRGELVRYTLCDKSKRTIACTSMDGEFLFSQSCYFHDCFFFLFRFENSNFGIHQKLIAVKIEIFIIKNFLFDYLFSFLINGN